VLQDAKQKILKMNSVRKWSAKKKLKRNRCDISFHPKAKKGKDTI